jgi:hypothetical protein
MEQCAQGSAGQVNFSIDTVHVCSHSERIVRSMSFRENSKKHVIENVKQGLPAFQMESTSTVKDEAVGLCDPKLKT